MSNIRVDLNTPIQDGTEVVFRSPVDCSQVTGLVVYYNGGSQEFMLADAHGNNVGDIDHLFAENVAVKVILDVTTGMAFVQNADTNAYLEGRFDLLADSIVCEASGSTIAVKDSSDRSLQGLRIIGHDDGFNEETGNPVGVGSKGNVEVTMLGKNLFKHIPEENCIASGHIVSVLENGVIVQGNGNASDAGTSSYSTGWYYPGKNKGASKAAYLKAGMVVTFSFDYTVLENQYGTTTDPTIRFYGNGTSVEFARKFNGFETGKTNKVVMTRTIAVDGEYYPQICLNSCLVKIENIQIEYSGYATTYEPYKEPQTLTVPTPGGLLGDGIGTFDEVDFAKGLLIRRCIEQTETPLPEDVLEAYAAFRPYKNGTTITNDEDAEMKVQYVADTKAYIDNKFNELATAIVALG